LLAGHPQDKVDYKVILILSLVLVGSHKPEASGSRFSFVIFSLMEMRGKKDTLPRPVDEYLPR